MHTVLALMWNDDWVTETEDHNQCICLGGLKLAVVKVTLPHSVHGKCFYRHGCKKGVSDKGEIKCEHCVITQQRKYQSYTSVLCTLPTVIL